MTAALLQVAGKFAASQALQAITPLGNGLINDTYRVKTHAKDFVLQRINPRVFPEPQRVMHNLAQLGQHIRQKKPGSVHLQIPAIIPTLEGQAFYQDDDYQLWRALELIQPAESIEHIRNNQDAAQIGFALAHFHRLCSDLAPQQLYDTLPGFHITPHYFVQHQQLLKQAPHITKEAEFRHCLAFIQNHQNQIDVLEHARQCGALNVRVIHGDPKLNNFLFLPNQHKIISLIDLDTVKPGLVHYDIGDCVRSCCHDKDSNAFDIERCSIILHHYLQEAGQFFSAYDFSYLYAAIWLIPFELGLRFFNDYLAGNQYFKVNQPRQNLTRATAQFALCDNIHKQKTTLLGLIQDLQTRVLD